MVTVAGHEEETTPLEVIESYLDNNEADKAIQCINEILSSTDLQMKMRLNQFIIIIWDWRMHKNDRTIRC